MNTKKNINILSILREYCGLDSPEQREEYRRLRYRRLIEDVDNRKIVTRKIKLLIDKETGENMKSPFKNEEELKIFLDSNPSIIVVDSEVMSHYI